MQGRQSYQPQLFSVFSMEALIPKGHLLRQIDEKIDFEFVRGMTAPLYCQENGRPSIDPVLFVRICLITYLCRTTIDTWRDARTTANLYTEISVLPDLGFNES